MSDCTTSRKCSKCHIEYPSTTEFFSPNRKVKSGLQAYCKKCAAEWQREYRRTHADTVHETDRRRQGTPERRASQRKNYWRDVEHSREMKRESLKRHPETLKQWRKENRQKWNEISRRRRARVKQADGVHTAEDIEWLYRTQKGYCWWCGKKIKGTYHVDHVIPLCRGGSDAIENLVISCPKCNLRKREKTPQEWIGRLL